MTTAFYGALTDEPDAVARASHAGVEALRREGVALRDWTACRHLGS